MLLSSATEAELEAVRLDFFALLRLYKRTTVPGVRFAQVRYKDVDFKILDLQNLLGLTGQEVDQTNGSRLLKRAAILHGDVAMLVIPKMPWQAGCLAPSVVLIRDGQRVGSSCGEGHLAAGRALLDAIRPDPRKDPTVLLWYQATIVFLLEIGNYASAGPQVDHAMELFPDDPQLLFEHGYYHEASSSPYVQPAVQVSRLEQFLRTPAAKTPSLDTRSAEEHLREAADLFRRALERNPDLHEARLRHGSVLGALGRHDQAAEELRTVVTAVQEKVFRYFAEMLLGNEEQALGRNDVARTHYREAAALCPSAQSPHIALSQLARQSGDRTEALAAMKQLVTLPADDRDRRDPWWTYYIWFHKNAESLLGELYRPFVPGGQS